MDWKKIIIKELLLETDAFEMRLSLHKEIVTECYDMEKLCFIEENVFQDFRAFRERYECLLKSYNRHVGEPSLDDKQLFAEMNGCITDLYRAAIALISEHIKESPQE